MKYEIIGKNGFTPTDAIKNYTIKKLDKIVSYFDDNVISEIRVVCKVYREFHRIEITIPAPSIVLRSETSDPDMYAAIDKSIDKLAQQIRKHKSKIKKQFEREGVSEVFSKEFDAQALEKDILASQLVKNKKISIEPMSVDDAIAAMELSEHDFFVFLDAETKEPHVVYKREDGDYAVIETTIKM